MNWKKRIKIGLPMILTFPALLGLARLIFGTGDVTAVLVILPSVPFLIFGVCVLDGIFDDFFSEELQNKNRDLGSVKT